MVLGYAVENPARIPTQHPDVWEQYMRIAIPMMCKSDVVVLLDGWEGSKGAKLENQLACGLLIPTYGFDAFVKKHMEVA